MGSYITTGFVFNGTDVNIVNRKLKAIIMYLSNGSERYKFVKASKDTDGNNWLKLEFEELTDIQEGYRLASKGFFGQIDLVTGLFTSNEIFVSVRVEKEADYFGLLVDIAEKDLIKSNDYAVLNAADDLMINFMSELYKVLKYNYAFCDNEAELQFSPNEFKNITKESKNYKKCTSYD